MGKTEKNKKEGVKKTCFLITPIGSQDSLTRRRVDQWREVIYGPSLSEEYEIIRADKIDAPGIITEQIIQYIVDADLVFIDYTGFVPNVMYEAAIRHLTEKPYIQIYEKSTPFPFDIHNLRAISYEPSDLNYPQKLVEGIKRTLKEINQPNYKSPQIIKEKFDFNKIVSDPENFVKLLKEYIVLPKESISNSKNESIVTIMEPNYASYLSGRKKVVCPKCGTIKTEYTSEAMGYQISFPNPTSFTAKPHYKCNVCGTEFEC